MMAVFKLEKSRTLAHLHKDGNFTGFSFPYVEQEHKKLADLIEKKLNKEEN